MKKGVFALFLLLALAGCGPAEVPLENPPAEKSVSLPETGPAGSLSAPAIVTQGREAAEAYDLPGPGQNFQHEMNRWGAGGVLALLAEVPEAGAAFYGLPYAKDAHESVLLRWGGQTGGI